MSGVDGCASCICFNGEIVCDAKICQRTASSQKAANTFATEFNDYTIIRNQLVKRYFSQFDSNRLKIITDKLGCKTTDCPQLLAASKIDYKVVALDRKEYTGRASKQNKVVIHSTDAETVNNSPSKQEVTSVGYSIKVTQYYEATVTKTIDISSDVSIQVEFVKFGPSFKFGRTSSEKRQSSNEITLDAPSQRIVVDSYTKMNVTFNFYQYEDINNYFLDFVIDNSSVISHPDVKTSSQVIFVNRPLDEFLMKNFDFLSTIQYENGTDIKIVERDGKFVLKNLPATEKIINFGVDVVFGKPETIPQK